MNRLEQTAAAIHDCELFIEPANLKYMNKADRASYADCVRVCEKINYYHKNTRSPYRVAPKKVHLGAEGDAKMRVRYSFEPRSIYRMTASPMVKK